jgi:hypothetical protein
VEWFKGLSPGQRACVACGLMVLSAAAVLTMRYERGSTVDRALDDAFKKNPRLQRQAVARFAGQVTIDGEPPGDLPQGSALFVAVHRKHPGQVGARPLHTRCDSTGHFAFSTYLREDGVAVGSYVVTIVKLHRTGSRKSAVFGPPDELKNLYSDPDKNAQTPEFTVDVKVPGRTDYRFDLAVAGQEPVESPGPHAVSSIRSW